MKKILISFSFLLLFFTAFSQVSSFEKTGFKPTFNSTVTLGTGINSYLNGQSSNYQFIAPEIQYKFRPKFALKAGLMVVSGNYLPVERTGNTRSNISSFAYFGGDYFVSDKLKLSGQVIYAQSPFSNNSYKAPIIYSASAEYKITKSLKVGIEVRHSQNTGFQNNNSRYLPTNIR